MLVAISSGDPQLDNLSAENVMSKGMNTPSGKRQTSKMPLDAWVDAWEKSAWTCIGRCRCR